jgi:hypothetical protein
LVRGGVIEKTFKHNGYPVRVNHPHRIFFAPECDPAP